MVGTSPGTTPWIGRKQRQLVLVRFLVWVYLNTRCSSRLLRRTDGSAAQAKKKSAPNFGSWPPRQIWRRTILVAIGAIADILPTWPNRRG
jgi:hypothetical protein